MKILALFVDMLGGEYSNLCNENAAFNCMDKFLLDLGGVLFSNCYAVAPDTPRSAACLWSGLYPKANQCTNRVKWPRDFLNRGVDNIWKILNSKNYTVNIFMDDNADKMGLIPLCGSEHVYTESIYQFFDQADVVENSFNFFYLPDLHYVLDELDYQLEKYEEALKFQLSIIKDIFNFYDAKKTFDYIIIFSDHGFKPEGIHKTPHVIEDIRTKILVQIYRKNDSELMIDRKLRANLDLMPTICEMLSYRIQNKIDGLSLCDIYGHDYILIEELGSFSSWFGQSIEHWQVVLKDLSRHWLECDGKWENSAASSAFDADKYEKMICEKMCDYEKNRAMFDAALEYDKYINEHKMTGKYSTGYPIAQKLYVCDAEEQLRGRKIILYGAGNVGKDYYRQLLKHRTCEIIAWVDLNYTECQDTDRKVEGIGRVLVEDYDYILLSVWSEHTAGQIKSMLDQIHVRKDRVLWSKPRIERVQKI